MRWSHRRKRIWASWIPTMCSAVRRRRSSSSQWCSAPTMTTSRSNLQTKRIDHAMRRIRLAIEVAFIAALLWVLGSAAIRAGSMPPSTAAEELAESVSGLPGLQGGVEQGDALHRMQRLFPEGACFTLTLYGISWANVAEHPAVDDALKKDAIARLS